MGKKYAPAPSGSSRLKEMPSVTATALKNSTAEVLDRVARGHAVAITKHDKPRAVIVAYDEYVAWKSKDAEIFNTFLEEGLQMLEAMQSPEQKAAALRAFNATPGELGEAALEGARREKRRRR